MKTIQDWVDFLNVDKDEERTVEEWKATFEAAGQWKTCPSGSYEIPRDEEGAPEDDALFGLAILFHNAVRAMDATEARTALAKLRERGEQLAVLV